MPSSITIGGADLIGAGSMTMRLFSISTGAKLDALVVGTGGGVALSFGVVLGSILYFFLGRGPPRRLTSGGH